MKNQTMTSVTWHDRGDGSELRPRSIAYTTSFATRDSASRTCFV
ncbi:hypothetical protein ATL42_1748 [Sanguibacter antarcticus]|uniref:Uncharacterized protein n=1 Tax=Sanguibacter antarcticus TaxID=372484 RepID=A0A2A9E4S4_9MICO|nr:hypothetical protein ATL42_1748 [Sanguibacter antarcticus]